jgi:hypothetical protein
MCEKPTNATIIHSFAIRPTNTLVGIIANNTTRCSVQPSRIIHSVY